VAALPASDYAGYARAGEGLPGENTDSRDYRGLTSHV
jgi:hypothetical protein